MRRLNDSDCETRCEAIAGLAKRKDPRAKGALVRELERDDTISLVFEAAAEFGDRTLLPYIQRHLLAAKGEKDVDTYWLRVVQDAEEALSNENRSKLREVSNP